MPANWKAAVLVLSIAAASWPAAAASIKLNPGVIEGKQIHLSNARNYAYCEIAPVLGKSKDAVAQFYNTSGASDCPHPQFIAIKAKQLAAAIGSELVYLNPTPQTARRHWVMDQLWAFKAGEDVDFEGVAATWVAAMAPADMKGMLKGPFTPGLIQRASKYLYSAGSTIFVMRTPDKKA